MRRQFIKEVQGDLLEMFDKEDSELHVIAHGANCFATMGAGIAAQIKKKYPEAYYADMYYQAAKPGDMERLGNISGAHNNEIYNLYTQYRPGANGDYCAIRLALRKLNALFSKDKDIKTLGLPLIGCGIAGLEWKKVKAIILDEITDMNLIIVHFTEATLEKIPTTCEEFNEKWKYHLEVGFGLDQGMMVPDKTVIAYVDKIFTDLESRCPLFTYSQIKYQRDIVVVNMSDVPSSIPFVIQTRINDLLKEQEL